MQKARHTDRHLHRCLAQAFSMAASFHSQASEDRRWWAEESNEGNEWRKRRKSRYCVGFFEKTNQLEHYWRTRILTCKPPPSLEFTDPTLQANAFKIRPEKNPWWRQSPPILSSGVSLNQHEGTSLREQTPLVLVSPLSQSKWELYMRKV